MSDKDCVSRKAVLALLNATSKDEMDEECYHRLYDAVTNMDAVPHEMTAREYEKAIVRAFHSADDAYCEWADAIDEGNKDKAVAIIEKWAREHPEDTKGRFAK